MSDLGTKVKNLVTKVKFYGTKACVGLVSAGTALSAVAINSFAFVESGGGSGGSWISSIDVTPITDSISSAIPTVLPALISVLAIRKGLSFVIGTIRKA